jgi:hypothetical protein
MTIAYLYHCQLSTLGNISIFDAVTRSAAADGKPITL